MPVLFQYAVEDGPVVLYEPWRRPVGETLDLIEWFLTHTMVFFNAAFDAFVLAKCYTIFSLCPHDWIPEEHIDEIALLEPKGQDGPALKPAGCFDLLLHSRKGPFQSLMAREDIRIRRVPKVLADALAEELEERIELDGIYFAKSADKDAPRWKVYDRKKDGKLDPNFKDVVLKFHAASGLKYLAEYVLKHDPRPHFEDIELDKQYRPKELGYAPTALSVSKEADWSVYKDGKLIGYAWPGVIRHHIKHWATNANAREYARLDVEDTRALDKHFGHPEPNDDDSVLACMVASVRWRGFKIDIPGIQSLLERAQDIVSKSPCNVNKPSEVRAYVGQGMDDMEAFFLAESTKKANLIAVGNWKIESEEECTKCGGKGCIRCGSGVLQPGPHPAAKLAKDILQVKIAVKKIELFNKLLRAGKLHASFKVIGTLSSRMSGADGLNVQGVDHTFDVRSQFPLAWEGMKLSIGDFSGFEVVIADAVCNDPELRADLLSGVKIHGTFGQLMHPDKTYEEIIASKGTVNDLYTIGKQGLFACILYGGTFQTLMRKFDTPEEVAKSAIAKLLDRYKGVKKWREGVFKAFCSMSQPDGRRVLWKQPADYVETMLGFRRYFTLENKICRALFDLAQKPPKDWRDCKVKVVRSNRVQFAGGAVSSALYGAAFGIQTTAMRAAANHTIQSVGAQITKSVQRKVWDLQPVGVHDWRVCTMQIHDEIIVVSPSVDVNTIAGVIEQGIESFRDKVPLLEMDWNKNAQTWADK